MLPTLISSGGYHSRPTIAGWCTGDSHAVCDGSEWRRWCHCEVCVAKRGNLRITAARRRLNQKATIAALRLCVGKQGIPTSRKALLGMTEVLSLRGLRSKKYQLW